MWGSARARVAFFLAMLVGAAIGGELAASGVSVQASSAATGAVQLTSNPGADVRPAWSPDGKSIAYQAGRMGGDSFEIWAMDADGKNPRAITRGPDDRHPYWSPDGQQIAFDAAATQGREIWIVNARGGNRRQVTRLGQESTFPAWSPNGRQLTFYAYQDGVMTLWIVGADGSNARPLVQAVAQETLNQCAFACHQALWSPDGTRIAFGAGDRRSIWVVSEDGADLVQVAPRTTSEPQHFPWWLSDGRLGYIVEYVTTAASWTEAWAVEAPRGSPSLLVGQIAHQGPLQWSPDESHVLFHSPRSGNFDIYVIDLKAPGGVEALQSAAREISPRPDDEQREAASGPSALFSLNALPPSLMFAAYGFVAGGLVAGGLIGSIGLVLNLRARRRGERS